jgi:hypothetical protein
MSGVGSLVLEGPQYVGVPGGPHCGTERESAAITAFQQQHHAPGSAAVHAPLYEMRRDGGRLKQVRERVGCGEKEVSWHVLQPVTREMQKQKIVGPTC